MNYFIYCDFSTLKCSTFEFASILRKFTASFRNINNYIWELEVDDISLLPYSENDCETIYLQFSDFVDSHSIFSKSLKHLSLLEEMNRKELLIFLGSSYI